MLTLTVSMPPTYWPCSQGYDRWAAQAVPILACERDERVLVAKERNAREEGGVSDRLDIGSDEVVILVSKIDITRFEALEDALDDLDAFVWGAVLDNDLDGRVKIGRTGAVTKDAPVAGRPGVR